MDIVIISPTVSSDKWRVSLSQLCKNYFSTSLQTSARLSYNYVVLVGATVEKLFVRSSLVRIWYFSCQWLRVITIMRKEGGGRKCELEAQRGKVIRDGEEAERKGTKGERNKTEINKWLKYILLVQFRSLCSIEWCCKYRVSQNYVNTNGLWYHLFPAKCVSGL